MPKKTKKKPKPSDVKAAAASSIAAKKKELPDGKTSEIKQLQDSLSSFFTPTSSRRARQPPPEKPIPEKEERSELDDVEEEAGTSSKQQQQRTVYPEPKDPGPGGISITWRTGRAYPKPEVIIKRGAPAASSSDSDSPQPCSSKTTAAELKKKKKKRKTTFRKPGDLPKGYKEKAPTSSSSSDEGENHRARIMPDPRFYYKGFYFNDCTNTSQDATNNSSGGIELIESMKSMENMNRMKPDFRLFIVDSDTEYEEEPRPDPAEFDSRNSYLQFITTRPKRYVKVIDGMTHAQRREHRQFALEFEELLDALKEAHLAYCDRDLKRFSKPFDPPEGFKGRCSGQILAQAQERMDVLTYRQRHRVSQPPPVSDPSVKRELMSEPSSPSSSSSSESSDSDDSENGFVDFRERFSNMDLKPIVDMNGKGWREIIPPKPLKDGAEEVSAESSGTTDSDDDPKPLEWEVAGAIPQVRPPAWERYRSTIERVLYRRFIRRACRNVVQQNKRKKKIHKFLEIGKYQPIRPIPPPPTKLASRAVNDEECQEVLPYVGMKEILDGASAEHREILIRHFNEIHKEDLKRIKEYDKAAETGPVPRFIYMNKYQMKTSYTCPLTFDLRTKDELFICDQCLGGWIDRDTYERHCQRCAALQPPGQMIYKDHDNRMAFFEVDALTYPTYCQMLCCLGIAYIEHKSLHTDIEPFLFYVLAKKEKDKDAYHLLGYFSKQKYGHSSCNLCCLLVLPCYQGKGYGRYLIDFSFLLSRIEKIPGTPERPLSEAADVLYYRYYYESFLEMVFSWWQCNERDGIDSDKEPFNLATIEEWTGICKRDMLKVLFSEGIVDVVKDPKDPNGEKLKFDVSKEALIEHMETQVAKKNRYWIKGVLLRWQPDFGTIEERIHFPLIQAEYEAREAGLLLENLPPSEPTSPPKPVVKKGRKKKGEKKVPKKKKKTVVKFYRNDNDEEFEAKNIFPELSRSQIFTNKQFLYQTYPYNRPPKKPKKRPTTSGKRRKPRKKKEAEEEAPKKPESEEDNFPNLFTEPEDEGDKNDEIIIEEEAPQPSSSKIPASRQSKSKGKKPVVAKKKSPPKRRGRKPAKSKEKSVEKKKESSSEDEESDVEEENATPEPKHRGRKPASCKEKSIEKKKPSSDDDDSENDDAPGPSRKPAPKPRGRKRSTISKSKKQTGSKAAESSKADAPGSCNVMSDLSKSAQNVRRSSDEEEDAGEHHMRVKIRGSSVEHSSSDDDCEKRPIPIQNPIDFHTFSPPMDDTFQMSPPSPRKSQKRSSRNRSVSFSRNPKESRTSSDYDEMIVAPNVEAEAVATGNKIMSNNGNNMEYEIYQQQEEPNLQEVAEEEAIVPSEVYSYSERIPGKEETEMPKLLPSSALEVPAQRMEINENDEQEDGENDDDDAPPMLSPNFATNNISHSPQDEAPPMLHNSNDAPPLMEGPPMLQNTASIPKNDSVHSHRAPESLQNPASRRSSTDAHQQCHSVPSQSIMQQQQQLPPLQQWHLQNEIYNNSQQQHQSHSLQDQQPLSHPQQMTPSSMQMSDPNSVYSMHSNHSLPPVMPPHIPPQMQQQLSYPPSHEAVMKSIEAQKQVEPKPPPKPKPKKKKKDPAPPPSLASSSSALPNPMLPYQKYPSNAYEAAFLQPYAMSQMAQFQPHVGYPSYPYPQALPTPASYPVQQFNSASFNPWPTQATPGYPGYPSFMPSNAAAAAAANQTKLYSQIQNFCPMGGAGVAGPSVTAAQNPMNPMMNQSFQQAAAAAAAATSWTQNHPPHHPFSSYFQQ